MRVLIPAGILAEKESKIVLAKLDATEEGAVAEKFEVSAILQTVFSFAAKLHFAHG